MLGVIQGLLMEKQLTVLVGKAFSTPKFSLLYSVGVNVLPMRITHYIPHSCIKKQYFKASSASLGHLSLRDTAGFLCKRGLYIGRWLSRL